MIKLREVIREAWRNTLTGVSKPIIGILVFALTIGVLANFQVGAFTQANADAAKWRTQGSAVLVLELAGAIDGAQCHALANTPGVAGSGAVRAGQEQTILALPSTSFSAKEATSGLQDVLRVHQVSSDSQGGLWVSEDLAQALGVTSANGKRVSFASALDVSVTGVYPYPDDGRNPSLAYNLISVVPPTGTFDSCWVEFWPENISLEGILALPVIAANVPAETSPQIQQFNSTKGIKFDPQDRLDRITTPYFAMLGVLVGLVLGFGLIHTRRLEIAGALHAGVDKISLVIQGIFETLAWVIPGVIVLSAFLGWQSLSPEREVSWAALVPGLQVVLLAAVGVVLGSVVATALIKEKYLFKYFKGR